jgi:DNA-binding NtrC family response regulator
MEKKPAEASAPQADQHNENSSHFEGAVILVVDDEPLQRDILKVILSDEGYQTQVAASAEEALIITRTLKPDVVLTDLRMYKMDGIELMEKLRSQTDAPEVIIMSAFGTPVIIEKSLKKGAFSFMTKPLDITQVLFDINKALEITAKVKYSDQRFHEKWR